MEGLNLSSTFAEFKEGKNIDRPTMMSVLEDIFRTQLARMYGDADNFDIIIIITVVFVVIDVDIVGFVV